jgi:hypothetical protein
MTKQTLNKGSSANDGTGDTLRAGAQKINENFTELYGILGGDSLNSGISFDATTKGLIFEGSSADDHETFLVPTNATADRTITLPNLTGTVSLITATETLTNKTLTTPILTNAVLNPTATTAGKIEFLEGTNNGTNKATLIGPASTADVTVTLPAATDTLVGKATTDTLTNKTLTTPTINSPKIGTEIQDENGNELVEITATGSAVNHFKLTNAATGNNVTLEATGSDTNVGLNVTSKGTGLVTVTTGVAFSEIVQTANGAVSLVKTVTVFNKGSALTATLANGTVVGQLKILTNKGAGAATTTPANFGAGTTIAIAQHKTATLLWDGTNWQIQSTYGGTVA